MGMIENIQDSFKNLRVLVTGDTGFKGSWLCEWLIGMGAECFGVGLAPNTDPSLFNQLGLEKRLHHVNLDIRDCSALKKHIIDVQPDIVFHLAAQPLVRLSYDIPIETYETNVMGTVHLLDALRFLNKKCAVVCITTDKCYENQEWLHSYRENDPMGGYDPYSSSKGACELAIHSYRRSFFSDPEKCGIAVASVRAGNVIGGGDWAVHRIIPDCISALKSGKPIPVRNRVATRPWQHVLEPLSGYIILANELWGGLSGQDSAVSKFHYTKLCDAFNFGPNIESNRTVHELVKEVLNHWEGSWEDQSDPNAPHEASLLNLSIDKAFHMLKWSPRWDFSRTVKETIRWYKAAQSNDFEAKSLTQMQINAYTELI
jgi:CDP-glucose 4,6-dehydratase